MSGYSRRRGKRNIAVVDGIVSDPQRVTMTDWHLCSCGRSWWASTKRSADVALRRCRANHIVRDNLTLSDYKPTIANTLFVIVSQKSIRHHEKVLIQEIKNFGGRHVHSVRGFKPYPDTRHMGKAIGYNKIATYSVRHRWFPRVAHLLMARRYAAVVYLEPNARFAASWREVLTEMKEADCEKDVFWIGWRKRRRLSDIPQQHGRGLPDILYGSKALAFRGHGLTHFWDILTESNEYSYLDLLLCERADARRIHVARRSLFGSAGHHGNLCSFARTSALGWKPKRKFGTRQRFGKTPTRSEPTNMSTRSIGRSGDLGRRREPQNRS